MRRQAQIFGSQHPFKHNRLRHGQRQSQALHPIPSSPLCSHERAVCLRITLPERMKGKQISQCGQKRIATLFQKKAAIEVNFKTLSRIPGQTSTWTHMRQDVHGHIRDGKFRQQSLIIHTKILEQVQIFQLSKEKKTSRVLLLKEERAFEHE